MNILLYTLIKTLKHDEYEIFLYRHNERQTVFVYVVYNTETEIAYLSNQSNVFAMCKFAPNTRTNIFGMKSTQNYYVDMQSSPEMFFDRLECSNEFTINIIENGEHLMITSFVINSSTYLQFVLQKNNEITHIFNNTRLVTSDITTIAQPKKYNIVITDDNASDVFKVVEILIQDSALCSNYDTLWNAINGKLTMVNDCIQNRWLSILKIE